MLKGVIRALGIQSKAVYINLCGHWVINMSLQYLLTYRLGWGMLGMWTAKVVMETYVFIAYSILISTFDWNKAKDNYE